MRIWFKALYVQVQSIISSIVVPWVVFASSTASYIKFWALYFQWLHSSYFIRELLLDEAQAGIKIARRNINNLRYKNDTTLTAESEVELKSLLMKVKEEGEKAGLKLNIQKSKIMACSPITSWQIDGETVETMTDFIFLGSKTTADGDCSHEIKRCLLFGKKSLWPM